MSEVGNSSDSREQDWMPGFRRNLVWTGVMLFAVGVLSLPLRAQIMLDADFDSGSLDVANSSANGNLVTLAGRDNYNTGQWKWLYFQVSGVQSQQLTFRIDDNFDTGGSDLVGHKMVYSYDNENWFFFDNNVRNGTAGTFSFGNNSPFAENNVWVAYGLPYPVARVVEHTQGLVSSPWVTPTISGNEQLVIGQSPGGIDDLGRVIASQDMFGYKITDADSGISKVKVVLSSGVHANETLGNFMLEGLVDFLVSDELQATLLRRYAEFYVYPMVNPDGRLAGYNRSTVQNESLDPNRYWVPPSYGGLDDVKVIASAMRRDTEAEVEYLLDFHSTVNGKEGHYGYILPAYQSDPLWQSFLELEPAVRTLNAALIDDTAAKFGREWLSAHFSATIETQFLPDENIDRFLTLGRNMGLALADTLIVKGDINFDGLLDAADWEIFQAGAETVLSEYTPLEAYSRGDLDGDGENSILDFAIFKQAYITAHGDSAFDALFDIVPEPTSISSLVSILAILISGRFFRAAAPWKMRL